MPMRRRNLRQGLKPLSFASDRGQWRASLYAEHGGSVSRTSIACTGFVGCIRLLGAERYRRALIALDHRATCLPSAHWAMTSRTDLTVVTRVTFCAFPDTNKRS